MKHYFTRLEEQIKANWNRPALGNYRGELFTFGEVATNIAKLHLLYENCGLKKGDKVVTIGGIYGTICEVKEGTVLMEVDNNVKIRVSKNALVKDFTEQPQ